MLSAVEPESGADLEERQKHIGVELVVECLEGYVFLAPREQAMNERHRVADADPEQDFARSGKCIVMGILAENLPDVNLLLVY